MYHVPMCEICGEHEVGSISGGHTEFCSDECADKAMDYAMDEMAQYVDEPEGSHDLSDDAEALASAGWGTDEDYGYYGEDF